MKSLYDQFVGSVLQHQRNIIQMLSVIFCFQFENAKFLLARIYLVYRHGGKLLPGASAGRSFERVFSRKESFRVPADPDVKNSLDIFCTGVFNR